MTLANAPLFGEFGEEQLRLIAFGARRREFRAGDVLFREGRTAEGASIVAAGRVSVETEAGERGTAGVYALLDETALLARRAHGYTATAETDGAIIVVDRPLFRRMIEEFPQIAERTEARILRRLATLASDAERPLRRLVGDA